MKIDINWKRMLFSVTVVVFVKSVYDYRTLIGNDIVSTILDILLIFVMIAGSMNLYNMFIDTKDNDTKERVD